MMDHLDPPDGFKPEYKITVDRAGTHFSLLVDQEQPKPAETTRQVVKCIRPSDGILMIKTNFGITIINQSADLMTFCREDVEELYILPKCSMEFRKLLNPTNCSVKIIKDGKDSEVISLEKPIRILTTDDGKGVHSKTPSFHDYKTEVLTSESGRWFMRNSRNHNPKGRFGFRIECRPPPVSSLNSYECFKWIFSVHTIAPDVLLFRDNSRIILQNMTGSEVTLKHFGVKKGYAEGSADTKIDNQSIVQFQNLNTENSIKFHVMVKDENFFLSPAVTSILSS